MLKKHQPICACSARAVPRQANIGGYGGQARRCLNDSGGACQEPAPALAQVPAGPRVGQAPQPRQNAGITGPIVPSTATSQVREASFLFNYMIYIENISNTPLRRHSASAQLTWDPMVPILRQIPSNHAFSCSCQSVASGILRGDRRRPCFVPDAPRVLIS